MSLPLVSETYSENMLPGEPAHARHYDLAPPVNLEDAIVFTSGQPFAAYAEMRTKAPVMWHPEAQAAGFWALTLL